MDIARQVIRTTLAGGQAAAWYLGQEGILVKGPECTVLFDPYLTEYVDRMCSSESVRWVRRYPAPCAPETLGFVDYVFCTHEHNDHCDPWTVAALAAAGSHTLFFASDAFSARLVEYGVPAERVVGVHNGVSYSYPGMTFAAIPAAHEQLHPAGSGYAEYGFRVELGGCGVRLYHAGDCCVYDGLAEAVGPVEAAFLPVNGRDYYRLRLDIIGNMDAREAALLARALPAELLIPLHYDLYDINRVDEAAVVSEFVRSAPEQRFHLCKSGERIFLARDTEE